MAWRRRVPDRIVNEPVLCIIPAEESPAPDARVGCLGASVVALQVCGQQLVVKARIRVLLRVLGDDVQIDVKGVDAKATSLK